MWIRILELLGLRAGLQASRDREEVRSEEPCEVQQDYSGLVEPRRVRTGEPGWTLLRGTIKPSL